MIEEFADSGTRAVFDSDVCIVGAGAAGVTLARRLESNGFNVLLLESGGEDYEKEIQDLGVGDSVGFPYYQLDQSRLRLFGGTTAVWGGRVVPLDPIDFESRPWLPHSGWPFGIETLRPYYDEAMRSLGLEVTKPSEAMWDWLGLRRPEFDPNVLRTNFFQFDEEAERFTLPRNQDFSTSQKIRVLLHATVLNLTTNPDGTTIQEIEIGNLRGGRGRVRARTFVLAAGGLETPRLLLNATGSHANGLGNSNDLVGRFFMEHPHARAARIQPDKLWQLLHLLPRSHRRNGLRYSALARPAEALQQREGILNSSFTFSVRRHPGASVPPTKWLYETLKWKVPHDQRGRSVWRLHRNARRAVAERIGPLRRWLRAASGRRGLYVVARAEQAPNPNSRVQLSEKRDVFGTRQMELDWQFQDVDKRTLAVSMDALNGELRRLGLGRLEASSWLKDDQVDWEVDPLISNHPVGGYHHMGTTRMAASPREGVVDADCRVHGLDNLYVAGSSVFPTGGWANPTLTILALALRLGDQITKTSAAGREA